MKQLKLLIFCFLSIASIFYTHSETLTLTIDDVFALAERNSTTLQAASAAVDVAEAGIDVAKNDKLPSIQADLSFSYIGDGWMSDRNFSNGARADMPHYGNNFALKATQVVYAGGAITTAINMSRLQKQIAETRLSDERQNVRFLLSGYYLQLCCLYNEKEVYQNNISQTEALLKEIRAGYDQGTALRTDITRYELQLQNLQLGLTHTENQIDILSRQLAVALGLDETADIHPDLTVIDSATRPSGESAWQLQRNQSPTLALAGKAIEMSRMQEDLARASRRPTIGLIAANEFNGPILIEVPPINKNFNYWYVGVGISYKFDSLFKSNKKLRQAKASTFQAEENYRVAEEATGNAVHEAYVNLNEAYDRIVTKEKNVQLAQENYDVVRNRYLSGLALITDMLDAGNVKLSSELELVNARINSVYQYYLLKKTIGTL